MDNLDQRPVITSPIGGRPRGLRVERSGEVLRIRYATRSFESVALGIVAAGLISLALSFAMAGEVGGWLLGGMSFCAGAVLGYVALVRLLNEHLIEATHEALTISSCPIPLSRSKRVNRNELVQLYVKARPIAVRWGPVARVVAVLHSGKRVAVTACLFGDFANWAPYIEKEIERHLGIVNRPILCSRCGYDLRASPRRCPECGLRFRWNKRERRAWRAGR